MSTILGSPLPTPPTTTGFQVMTLRPDCNPGGQSLLYISSYCTLWCWKSAGLVGGFREHLLFSWRLPLWICKCQLTSLSQITSRCSSFPYHLATWEKAYHMVFIHRFSTLFIEYLPWPGSHSQDSEVNMLIISMPFHNLPDSKGIDKGQIQSRRCSVLQRKWSSCKNYL